MHKCSFLKFRDAVGYSKIVELFDRYGFASERQSFRHFQSVMDNSRVLPSAWYLKSFVYSKDQILPSELRVVEIDYGFNHCRDAIDRTRLRQAYRDLFDQKSTKSLFTKRVYKARFLNVAGHFSFLGCFGR